MLLKIVKIFKIEISTFCFRETLQIFFEQVVHLFTFLILISKITFLSIQYIKNYLLDMLSNFSLASSNVLSSRMEQRMARI